MASVNIEKDYLLELINVWQSKIKQLEHEYIDIISQVDKDFEKVKEKKLEDKRVELDRLTSKRDNVDEEYRKKLADLDVERYEVDAKYNEQIKITADELEPKKERIKSKYNSEIGIIHDKMKDLHGQLEKESKMFG